MTTGNGSGTPPEGSVSDDAVPFEPANEEQAPAEASLETELEELRSKYLRAVADYQNLRRRSDEERKEWGRFTLTSVIVNYLPVLDDLDRALESVDSEIAEHRWVEGVRMVERKFRTVLESSGVQPIEADGQAFDPAMHEAISYAPGPEGQVVAVVQAGYTIDGRVVRPARVVVGSGQPGGPAAN